MKEPIFARILTYALYVAFVIGLVFVATVSFMLEHYLHLIHGSPAMSDAYRLFIIPFLKIVGVLCLWAVVEMILMLRSIPRDPFVMRNVQALYRIGIIALVLAAAFLVKCFVFLTLLTMVCVLLFLAAGLFAFTLAALIRQSIVFREENALTI